MFVYQKKLQYPVRIKNTNPKLAAQIITQYGGPKCNWVQKGPLQPATAPSDIAPIRAVEVSLCDR